MNHCDLPEKRQKLGDEWRKSAHSFHVLIRTMYDKQCNTDVAFNFVGIESEEVNCHKFILSAHSQILNSMLLLRENDVNGGNKIVLTLTDDNPQYFRKFVEMMYWSWDDVTYEDYNLPDGITPEIAVGVLFLAYKYSAWNIISLTEHFIHSFLKVGLAKNTAKLFSLLQGAPMCCVGQAGRKVFRTVDGFLLGQGQDIFSSDAVLELSHSNLCNIVQRKELRCSEYTVYSGCYSWAVAECQRRGIGFTGGNIRNVLGDVLKSIQFDIIDVVKLTDEIFEANVLTQDEIIDILTYRVNKNCVRFKDRPFRFPSLRRILNTKEFQIRRLDLLSSPENLVDFSSPHGFEVESSKDVYLTSMVFYAGPSNTIKYLFHIEVEFDQKNFHREIKEFSYGSKSNIAAVYIEPAIKIPAHTSAKIKFTVTGGPTYISKEIVEDVTKEFVYWEGDTLRFIFRACSTIQNGLRQIPMIFLAPPDNESAN